MTQTRHERKPNSNKMTNEVYFQITLKEISNSLLLISLNDVHLGFRLKFLYSWETCIHRWATVLIAKNPIDFGLWAHATFQNTLAFSFTQLNESFIHCSLKTFLSFNLVFVQQLI